MKTMFGRMFALTAALLLLSCMVLGVTFRVEFGKYLVEEKRTTLLSNASTVANLAAAYNTTGELADNWDFRIGLSVATDVADSEVLICDNSGSVVICSTRDAKDTPLGTTVPADVLQKARESGEYCEKGTLGGFFPAEKLTAVMPVASRTTGDNLGFVVVTAEMTQVKLLLAHTTNIFLITGVIVFAAAIAGTSYFARKETEPLKHLATIAREFGHGNLSVRAETGGGNTEEMDELTAAFNNMATSLEQSETQRREFIANVSHELKTPMTTIAGFLDGMLDGTIPPEQHPKYMMRVSDEVRRLSRLVRSMLEISRIQNQGIPDDKKTKFNICESIGRVLLSFEQKINAKRLHVEVQMPDNGVGVFAQEDAITQVVYNLIDNAVKFCSEGGNLYLQVESDGSKATISVANTGPTIPEEELPLVFDRFHKTDKSRSMDRDGVGLGLYIVRTIVVQHGEDISVTSRDGVTRFSFTLPVR